MSDGSRPNWHPAGTGHKRLTTAAPCCPECFRFMALNAAGVIPNHRSEGFPCPGSQGKPCGS